MCAVLCPYCLANWLTVRKELTPCCTLVSSCERFCSVSTNDTVSGVFLGVLPKTRDPGRAAGSLPPDTGTSCACADAVSLADAIALPVRLTPTTVAVATNPSPIDLNELERRLRLMFSHTPRCSKSALYQLRSLVLARACRARTRDGAMCIRSARNFVLSSASNR